MRQFHVPQGYRVGIKLTTPDKVIQAKALKALAAVLNQELPRIARYVQEEISKKTDPIFTASQEYQLMINGNLRGDFGFPRGEEEKRLKAVLAVLSKQIVVEATKVTVSGNTFRSGGLKVFMFKKDFRDLFDLPEAKVVTENGDTLPWLEWLLLGGNMTLISGYDVRYGNYGGRTNRDGMVISRSGIAIMVPGETLNWDLGPLGGTQNNNWLTRAIELSFTIEYIDTIVEEAMIKWFSRFAG